MRKTISVENVFEVACWDKKDIKKAFRAINFLKKGKKSLDRISFIDIVRMNEIDEDLIMLSDLRFVFCECFLTTRKEAIEIERLLAKRLQTTRLREMKKKCKSHDNLYNIRWRLSNRWSEGLIERLCNEMILYQELARMRGYGYRLPLLNFDEDKAIDRMLLWMNKIILEGV
jgi:hypothetical protein